MKYNTTVTFLQIVPQNAPGGVGGGHAFRSRLDRDPVTCQIPDGFVYRLSYDNLFVVGHPTHFFSKHSIQLSPEGEVISG